MYIYIYICIYIIKIYIYIYIYICIYTPLSLHMYIQIHTYTIMQCVIYTGVCEKSTPPEKKTLGRTSSKKHQIRRSRADRRKGMFFSDTSTGSDGLRAVAVAWGCTI